MKLYVMQSTDPTELGGARLRSNAKWARKIVQVASWNLELVSCRVRKQR